MKKHVSLCMVMVLAAIVLSGCDDGYSITTEQVIEKTSVKYVDEKQNAVEFSGSKQMNDKSDEESILEDTESEPDNNDTEASYDKNQLTGSVEVIKDSEFVLLTDDGKFYEFPFDRKPVALVGMDAGTKVCVTYEGEISDDNTVNGNIISIEIKGAP